MPDLHPYTAALLRQSVHLVLKYSVYHNTESREVSHVLFLQIVRMCNTHPFSSTVLSPHPAFLLSYSVHRLSGKYKKKKKNFFFFFFFFFFLFLPKTTYVQNMTEEMRDEVKELLQVKKDAYYTSGQFAKKSSLTLRAIVL